MRRKDSNLFKYNLDYCNTPLKLLFQSMLCCFLSIHFKVHWSFTRETKTNIYIKFFLYNLYTTERIYEVESSVKKIIDQAEA